MIPVARAKGTVVHAPQGGIVAFNSSPYPVHVQGGAIDIFHSREFGAHSPSPVSGEVVLIDKSKVGISRHFKSDPFDYITVLRTNEICVRILHIEPMVEVGDSVEVGDTIGRYIRTPLLPFWSYPHAHVEVKECTDVEHPLNAFPLEPAMSGEFCGSPELNFDSFRARVRKFTGNYVLVEPEIDIFGRIDGFHGISVSVGREMGLLDSQTPWNCYGGVILGSDSRVKTGDEVRFGTSLLGCVARINGNLATYALGSELGDGIDRYSKGLLFKDVGRFNVPYRRMGVNGTIFLGISTGLFLSEEKRIRLVPLKPLEQRFEPGETIEIDLEIPKGNKE